MALVSLLAPAPALAAFAYNTYTTAVTGSARQVALGGATLSLPDDYSAVFLNPAGLGGLTGTGIDFGSDSNALDNFIVDLDNPKARALSVPLKYSFFGVRFVSESGWGFGVAAQTPFEDDSTFFGATTTRKLRRGGTVTVANFDESEVKITDNVYTAAVGKAFFDRRLALGAAFNYWKIDQFYSYSPVTTPGARAFTRDATRENATADFGAIAAPWRWLRAGLVYKMGTRVGFDPSLNQGLPFGLTPFRDVKSPDRISLGIGWLISDKFRLFTSSDYVMRMRQTFVVGSGVFPGSPGSVVESGQKDVFNGHWGAEFIPIDEPDLTFKFWAGGYLENTGIQGGYSRYHRTAGFGLSPWFLSLSMAVDDTENYNNFVIGLGVDLLQVSARVARHFNWKLPL